MKNTGYTWCLYYKDYTYKPNADIEIGAHIARIAQLGNIALKTGRKVSWDASTGKFPGDEEANRLLKAKYREPWELPVI